MKTCDLHTHSFFSDGTLSPTDLLNKAYECGLSAIALCDHNVVDGLLEFVDLKNESGEVDIDVTLDGNVISIIPADALADGSYVLTVKEGLYEE